MLNLYNGIDMTIRRSVLTFLVLLSFSITAKVNSFKMGYFTVAPHIMVCDKSSRPCGALVEYIDKFILPQINYDIQWVGPMSILRLLDQMKKGNVDMAGLIAKNNEINLNEIIYTSNKVTHIGKWHLVTSVNLKNKKITKASELYGLNIAFYKSLDKFNHPILADEKLKLYPMTGARWFERNFLMIERGRYDSAIMPEEAPIRYMLKKYKVASKYKVIPIPGMVFDFNFAFNKTPKGKLLKELFDKAMLKAPLTYEEYLKNYIDNDRNFKSLK